MREKKRNMINLEKNNEKKLWKKEKHKGERRNK